MTAEENQSAPRRPQARKAPRQITERYLENAALHYLKRFSSTLKQLERVLLRKMDRSLKFHGGDRPQALGWLAEVLAKLVRNGLVDDRAYAETKAHAMRAAGQSTRVMTMKLKLKGVADDVVQAKVRLATAEVSEVEAARTWARKKRLGPYRRDPSTRAEKRQKDLASLARAGFPFSIAKQVLDSTDSLGDFPGPGQ